MPPRLHLFEFEDQTWFPAMWRDMMTDYLRHVEGKFGLYKHAITPLEKALRDSGENRIVDLGSGAGGPLLEILEHWPGQERPAVVLTDLFPHAEALAELCRQAGPLASFRAEPVDARSVPRDLPGLRTLFNGFHHFRPTEARAVLADAVTALQPVAIFEVAERRAAAILPLALVPIFVLVMTPFIRPFRWSRLLWTYLIPVLPLAILWDGVVSYLRAYTPNELLALGRAAGPEGYRWESGYSQAEKTPGRMTWLVGIPRDVGCPPQ